MGATSSSYYAVEPRFGHSMVASNGRVFLFGGVGRDGLFHNDFYYSSMDQEQRWTRVAGPHPSPRNQAAMVACGGGGSGGGAGGGGGGGGKGESEEVLYIFGGYDGTKALRDLYQVNTGSGQFSAIAAKGAPTARDGALAVSYGGRMWIHGGSQDGPYADDLYSYNYESATWLKHTVAQGDLGPGPVAHHVGVVTSKGKLFVFGGYQTTRTATSMWCLDLEGLRWEPVGLGPGSLPHRAGAAAALFRDHMIIGGGLELESGVLTQEVVAVNLTANLMGVHEVLRVGRLSVPGRVGATMVMVDTNMWLCGNPAGATGSSFETVVWDLSKVIPEVTTRDGPSLSPADESKIKESMAVGGFVASGSGLGYGGKEGASEAAPSVPPPAYTATSYTVPSAPAYGAPGDDVSPSAPPAYDDGDDDGSDNPKTASHHHVLL